MHTNEYMNNYMKNRWIRRRQEAVDKLGGLCYDCGSSDNLEFDHIDPATKSFTIASGSSFSEERFWQEIDKCQLLCFECHKKKHAWKHGTLAGYRYCKCDQCREAWNTHSREYKRKRRTLSE